MADDLVIPQYVVDKFWRFANPTDDQDSCWIWSGPTNSEGYAFCHLPKVAAHICGPRGSHVSMVLHGRPRPARPYHLALHGDCSNPACVSPHHLRWGSDAENTSDKKRLGRIVAMHGSKSPHARLTETDAAAIRVDGRKQRDIAADYGISQMSVFRIIHRMSWKHVP